jgi:SOS-response transcriptional repressor LexA
VEEVAVPLAMVRAESAAFALRAAGEGLRGEQIRHGDLLVLERGTDLRDGETVLVLSREGTAALRSVDERLRRSAETGEATVAGLLRGVVRTY